ncbi:MAG: hypothetical protein CVV44_23385 [Spirochaetae bacterium HGW-Spirochaetae-1]|jgi:hypothetical protein|nr:MAG: hypothetical protein CVV44_23385 [Spirochaetae bacterium HGW-Spirochaetae-1]
MKIKKWLIALLVLPFLMIFVSCVGGGGTGDTNTYSVVFEENDADTLLTDLTGFEAGVTVPQPDIINKTGSLFDGWFSSETFEEESRWIFGDGGTTISGNTTLFAKWIPYFTFSETDTEATVTGMTDEGETVEDLVLPLIYNGKPVTSIDGNAVSSNSTIKTITIGRSITEIATPQFEQCYNLTAIYVVDENESLKAVDGVLYDKEVAKLIAYPPGKVGTSYSTPVSVATVGYFALFDAKNLETIIIDDNVTSIEGYAFRQCVNLTSITLPAELSQLSQGLFTQCAKLSSVTIPSSVTTLSSYLFDGCTMLKTMTIPEQVTTISSYCFVNSGLTSIHIPVSVTSIGAGAFSNIGVLTAITVAAGNPNYSSSSGVLFNKTGTTLLMYPIGKTDTSYVIPAAVTDIAEYAFYGCSTLEDITFNEGLEYIGNLSFYECTSLTEITLPSTLESTGYRVFESCSQLNTVVMGSDAPPVITGDRIFSGAHSTLAIYVPTGFVDDYKEAVNWITYVDQIFDVATMP